MKCANDLKSIAPLNWTDAIDRSYQSDHETAFLTLGVPASDEPAPDHQSLREEPFMTRRCKTSIAAAVLAVIAACAFAEVVWQRPIRHETITFYDANRGNRPVAVEIVVRRTKKFKLMQG
jgi:hypothetical protein